MNWSILVQLRAILANGKFWSGILCAASFTRGTAYLERPPTVNSLATRAIETYLSYQVWGILLLVTTTLIGLGWLTPWKAIGIIGHCFSVIIYGTFGLSLGLAAIFSGESWANTGLYMVGAVLHVACAVYMADEVAKQRQGGGD
jgi:hypothetical protein